MSQLKLSTNESPWVGLVAAWGRYPIVVAEALKAQGYRVACLGVMHHADPVLESLCDEFRWVGLAKFGQAVRFFRRHGVSEATMAGKFHKVMLYQPWIWARHLPDWATLRKLARYFVSTRNDHKDDTLLGAIVDAFADYNIRFAPATDYVPELLLGEGRLTGGHLSSAQRSDIRFAWQLAKEMGRLDVGQSVCVKDRAVLAVEAIEGTDACITRAGELCGGKAFTVVKVAKPQQDMRFDVPTIGIGTLRTMAAAGAKTLAVEADKTIILDADDFVAYARQKKITVVAYRGGAEELAAA